MTALGPAKHRNYPDHSQLRQTLSQAVSDTGLRAAEIARRAGVDRRTVAYALSGQRRASMPTWDKILRGAGVELGYRIKRET